MLRKSHKLLICETFAGKPDTTAARLSYFDFFFLFIFNHIPGHYNLAGFELFTVLFEEIKLKSMSSSESSRLRMTGIKLQTWSKTSLTLHCWQHPILQSVFFFLHRLNHRTAIKHSQSGDVSQASQRPKSRRKLQRGQSEDVQNLTRPQVKKSQSLKCLLYNIHSKYMHLCLCCLSFRNRLNWSRWRTLQMQRHIPAWKVTAEQPLFPD